MRHATLPERAEVDQLDHLAELGEVIDGGLRLLQFQPHGIRLMHDLKDGIADGALVESVIDVRHFGD